MAGQGLAGLLGQQGGSPGGQMQPGGGMPGGLAQMMGQGAMPGGLIQMLAGKNGSPPGGGLMQQGGMPGGLAQMLGGQGGMPGPGGLIQMLGGGNLNNLRSFSPLLGAIDQLQGRGQTPAQPYALSDPAGMGPKPDKSQAMMGGLLGPSYLSLLGNK